MTEYKIEDGVPMPQCVGGLGRKAKYPYRQLEVGQSFFWPNIRVQSASTSACNTARRIGNGVKFACRNVTENGVKGVRVWRIA